MFSGVFTIHQISDNLTKTYLKKHILWRNQKSSNANTLPGFQNENTSCSTLLPWSLHYIARIMPPNGQQQNSSNKMNHFKQLMYTRPYVISNPYYWTPKILWGTSITKQYWTPLAAIINFVFPRRKSHRQVLKNIQYKWINLFIF